MPTAEPVVRPSVGARGGRPARGWRGDGLLRAAGNVAAALVIAYTVSFLAFEVLPGDPARILVGTGNVVTEEQLDAVRQEWGLDRPAPERYLTGLLGLLRADLGVSYRTGRSVIEVIGEALTATAPLALSALALALLLALALSVGAAVASRAWLRRALQTVPVLLLSVPSFWLGILLIQVFSFQLRLLPSSGSGDPASLVLPALTLALPAAALLGQTLMASLLGETTEPYAENMLARGQHPLRVAGVHALRNALLPTMSMIALMVGWLLAGSVIVETVFARNGFGRVVLTAVSTQDLPVLQGVVLVATAVFVTANLLVEAITPLVDPRQRPHVRRRARAVLAA